MIEIDKHFLNIPLAIAPNRTEFLEKHGSQFQSAIERMNDKPVGFQIISGIAVIPVNGLLIQRLGSMSPFFGMTGYDGIKANMLLVLADPMVKAIMLNIDSPGGEVAGCFDLCDFIYEARGIKPIWASCDESAYSAAYAIASACDFITVPRTGGVGSIGVICLHVDVSRALDKQGITVSIIQFGARKADGNETLPLSDAARERQQNAVDTMGMMFCETVARNRDLSVAAVVATEATTFLGQAGVLAGFADEVASHEEAFELLDHLLSR